MGGMMGVIAGLAIFFLVAIAATAFVLAIGSLARDEKKQAKAESEADRLLDEAFSTESVTIHVGPATMKYETVVLGAKGRGYRLVAENAEPGNRKTLIFTTA